MRKLIVLLAVIASSAIIVTSCGGKKTAEIPAATAETVEGQKSQLAEALSTGNLRQASAMADSMSLFVDDFTPRTDRAGAQRIRQGLLRRPVEA